MATHDSTRNPSTDNTLTRRTALSGAAACGALVLPAGAAVAAENPSRDVRGFGTDPLIELWREHVALGAAINADSFDDDPRFDRLNEIEQEIEAARPADLIGLSVQVAYAAYWSRIGTFPDQVCEMVEAAAGSLANHTGVVVPEDRA